MMNQKGLVSSLIILSGAVILIGTVVGAWYTKLIKIPNLPPPGCYYEQVQCIKAPCDPVLYCETFQERLSRQNPMVFPSKQPQPTNKPSVDTSTLNNTTDETVNWKTYTNTKVGFSLRYPSRYPDKPIVPSGLEDEVYSDGTEDVGSPIFGKTTDDSIQLEFFPFSGTIDELITNERVNSFPPYSWVYGTPYLDKRYNTITSKEYTVDGVKGRWITVNNSGYYADSPKERDDGIFFIAKGHGFILHTSNHDQQEIVQMLSTFKFLK